tara:strand:- start:5913 stop:6377 length:465 start_codon:yes stop_codon:yes gene_type:complete
MNSTTKDTDNEIIDSITTKENYDTLKATIEALCKDFIKFEDKKVKAAGQRVRNNLLNAKKLCDTLRKQIMKEMRELPTKHRISSSDDEETKEETKEEVICPTQAAVKSEEEETKEETKEETPPSEREMMETAGELEPVITKTKRKPRKANKKKD